MPTRNQPPAPAHAVGSALLIDGDNDPHLPPDFEITPSTLVRIFLRPGAAVPRALDKQLGSLPMKTAVLSQEGGRNAADFVMALHAGLLHATLPMHVPFTLVTADKKLGAIVEELSRIGRPAVLWTSHPDRPARRSPAKRKPAAPRTTGSSRTSRAGRGTRKKAAPASDSELERAVRAYAARLKRVKDPPGKLKTLLNDIANRAGLKKHRPEELVEELKRLGHVAVDAQGRVKKGS